MRIAAVFKKNNKKNKTKKIEDKNQNQSLDDKNTEQTLEKLDKGTIIDLNKSLKSKIFELTGENVENDIFKEPSETEKNKTSVSMIAIKKIGADSNSLMISVNDSIVSTAVASNLKIPQKKSQNIHDSATQKKVNSSDNINKKNGMTKDTDDKTNYTYINNTEKTYPTTRLNILLVIITYLLAKIGSKILNTLFLTLVLIFINKINKPLGRYIQYLDNIDSLNQNRYIKKTIDFVDNILNFIINILLEYKFIIVINTNNTDKSDHGTSKLLKSTSSQITSSENILSCLSGESLANIMNKNVVDYQKGFTEFDFDIHTINRFSSYIFYNYDNLISLFIINLSNDIINDNELLKNLVSLKKFSIGNIPFIFNKFTIRFCNNTKNLNQNLSRNIDGFHNIVKMLKYIGEEEIDIEIGIEYPKLDDYKHYINNLDTTGQGKYDISDRLYSNIVEVSAYLASKSLNIPLQIQNISLKASVLVKIKLNDFLKNIDSLNYNKYKDIMKHVYKKHTDTADITKILDESEIIKPLSYRSLSMHLSNIFKLPLTYFHLSFSNILPVFLKLLENPSIFFDIHLFNTLNFMSTPALRGIVDKVINKTVKELREEGRYIYVGEGSVVFEFDEIAKNFFIGHYFNTQQYNILENDNVNINNVKNIEEYLKKNIHYKNYKEHVAFNFYDFTINTDDIISKSSLLFQNRTYVELMNNQNIQKHISINEYIKYTTHLKNMSHGKKFVEDMFIKVEFISLNKNNTDNDTINSENNIFDSYSTKKINYLNKSYLDILNSKSVFISPSGNNNKSEYNTGVSDFFYNMTVNKFETLLIIFYIGDVIYFSIINRCDLLSGEISLNIYNCNSLHALHDPYDSKSDSHSSHRNKYIYTKGNNIKNIKKHFLEARFFSKYSQLENLRAGCCFKVGAVRCRVELGICRDEGYYINLNKDNKNNLMDVLDTAKYRLETKYGMNGTKSNENINSTKTRLNEITEKKETPHSKTDYLTDTKEGLETILNLKGDSKFFPGRQKQKPANIPINTTIQNVNVYKKINVFCKSKHPLHFKLVFNTAPFLLIVSKNKISNLPDFKRFLIDNITKLPSDRVNNIVNLDDFDNINNFKIHLDDVFYEFNNKIVEFSSINFDRLYVNIILNNPIKPLENFKHDVTNILLICELNKCYCKKSKNNFDVDEFIEVNTKENTLFINHSYVPVFLLIYIRIKNIQSIKIRRTGIKFNVDICDIVFLKNTSNLHDIMDENEATSIKKHDDSENTQDIDTNITKKGNVLQKPLQYNFYNLKLKSITNLEKDLYKIIIINNNQHKNYSFDTRINQYLNICLETSINEENEDILRFRIILYRRDSLYTESNIITWKFKNKSDKIEAKKVNDIINREKIKKGNYTDTIDRDIDNAFVYDDNVNRSVLEGTDIREKRVICKVGFDEITFNFLVTKVQNIKSIPTSQNINTKNISLTKYYNLNLNILNNSRRSFIKFYTKNKYDSRVIDIISIRDITIKNDIIDFFVNQELLKNNNKCCNQQDNTSAACCSLIKNVKSFTQHDIDHTFKKIYVDDLYNDHVFFEIYFFNPYKELLFRGVLPCTNSELIPVQNITNHLNVFLKLKMQVYNLPKLLLSDDHLSNSNILYNLFKENYIDSKNYIFNKNSRIFNLNVKYISGIKTAHEMKCKDCMYKLQHDENGNKIVEVENNRIGDADIKKKNFRSLLSSHFKIYILQNNRIIYKSNRFTSRNAIIDDNIRNIFYIGDEIKILVVGMDEVKCKNKGYMKNMMDNTLLEERLEERKLIKNIGVEVLSGFTSLPVETTANIMKKLEFVDIEKEILFRGEFALMDKGIKNEGDSVKLKMQSFSGENAEIEFAIDII